MPASSRWMFSSRPASSARSRAALGLLALTVLLGVAAWWRWPHVVVRSGFLASDDPLVTLDRELTEEFGLARPVVFLVVSPRGSLWTRPGLTKIVAVTRDVLALPGVIATDVVSLASPNMRELRLSDGGLAPSYLMAEVPADDAAIAALRAHVDADPNYGGNLVSRDGEAALVVANFMPAATDASIASAALALSERHADETARVFAVGSPVMMPLARRAARPVILCLALALLLGAGLLAYGFGIPGALAALCAAILSSIWATAALVGFGELSLPWSAYGLATGALLAAMLAVVPPPLGPRGWLAVAAPPIAAALAFVFWLEQPVRALGVSLLASVPSAVLAAMAIAMVRDSRAAATGRRAAQVDLAEDGAASPDSASPRPASQRVSIWLRLACLTGIAVAWFGAIGIPASFGIGGLRRATSAGGCAGRARCAAKSLSAAGVPGGPRSG